MAPSQRSVLALLGLVASVHAVPAALANANIPARQIGLNPPSYSVSWETAAPAPTEDPEDPEEPGFPVPAPTPSNQISLSPPSYSISWDTGGPAPEPTEEPEDPEEPGFPVPAPTPSNQISLNPPSYSVSWDGPIAPTKTPRPGNPESPTRRPTKRPPPGLPTRYSVTWFTGRPKNTGGVSWATAAPPNTGGVSWDGPQPTQAPGQPEEPEDPEDPEEPDYPEEPEEPVANPPKPSDQVTLNPPSNTVIWGKRQFVEDPEPTEEPNPEPEPEDPEDPEPFPEDPEPFPEDPEDLFPFPPIFPTPANSFGLAPPKATIIWGKRQFVEDPEPSEDPDPEPEDPEEPFPEDPEDPEDPFLFPPDFPPANSIGIQPPRVTVIWGKRQFGDDPTPTDEPEPEEPEPFPEDPEDPFPEDPEDPFPFPPIFTTPPNSIGIQPPRPSISWGKRQIEEDPTPTAEPSPEDPEDPFPEDPEEPFPFPPSFPTPPNSIGIQPPRPTISWGKRQYEEDPEPTEVPSPEDPEDPFPEDPEDPFPFPPNFPLPPISIGIQPPRFSISWGKRQEDEPAPTDEPVEDPTGFPPQPTPSNEISIQPPSASISWGKRAPQTNSYGFEFTKLIPSYTPPRATPGVQWGKRQEAEPTGPIPIGDLPPLPVFPTPTNEASMASPIASVSWGKREAEAAPQTDEIGYQPPTATVIWGRDAKPEAEPQSNEIGIQPPKGSIIWGKRDAEAAPQTDEIGYQPPSATVIWGRDAEAAPAPQGNEIGFQPPKATIIWGKDKRQPVPEAEAVADADPQYSFAWPTNFPRPSNRDPGFPWAPAPSSAYVSWGKRDAAPEPTTLRTSILSPNPTPLKPTPVNPSVKPTPPRDTNCPTVTQTIAPPCVPPSCPHAKETPCDYNKPIPKMKKQVVVEKTIVTISTVMPTAKPTLIVDLCTDGVAVTKTVYATCPTYTCVPFCDMARIVR